MIPWLNYTQGILKPPISVCVPYVIHAYPMDIPCLFHRCFMHTRWYSMDIPFVICAYSMRIPWYAMRIPCAFYHIPGILNHTQSIVKPSISICGGPREEHTHRNRWFHDWTNPRAYWNHRFLCVEVLQRSSHIEIDDSMTELYPEQSETIDFYVCVCSIRIPCIFHALGH